jgi:hypothetical protein
MMPPPMPSRLEKSPTNPLMATPLHASTR